MVFMAHPHAPEVLPLGEQPFHLPAAFVPAERAAVRCFGAFAVRAAQSARSLRRPRRGLAG
jgi:hypothetical protein